MGRFGEMYRRGLAACMKAMMGWFSEMYRRGLTINAGKSTVRVLNGEGSACEVYVDRIRLEHVSEFK